MKKLLIAAVALMLVLAVSTQGWAVQTKTNKVIKDYSGMGIFWSRVDNGLKVVTIFKDSPLAEHIRVGDVITEINGSSVRSYMGMQVIEAMEQNPGLSVTVSFIRANKKYRTEINSRPSEVYPSNIEITSIPIGKITVFLTEQFFYSNLNTSDDVRSGDIFLVFSGDEIIGLARVRESSYHHSEFIMIRFYSEVITRNKDKYRLVYYRHSPIVYTPGK